MVRGWLTCREGSRELREIDKLLRDALVEESGRIARSQCTAIVAAGLPDPEMLTITGT